MKLPDADPAFPSRINDLYYFGISARDYFAGQALTGIMSIYYSAEELTLKEATQLAYEAADAMLAERNKKKR